MQRLTEVRPPGEAWTKYTYTLGSPTSLSILRRPFGSDTAASPETSSYLYFDSFGRLLLSKEQFPEGWSTTKTGCDLLGRVVSTSMPEFRGSSSWENFTPAHVTTTSYDRFDRPRIITLPDLRTTTLSYTGNRETRRTACVSALQTQAPCPTGEFPFTTIETFDGYGRRSTVTEPLTTNVMTTYGYDVGNRLASVSTNAPEGLQHRTFAYDLAGLLISEQHPEKGIDGYGTVSYPEYDARGHLRHRIDGPAGGQFDTTFVYDSAERVASVRDLDPATHGPRVLKVFTYGIDNPTNDPRLGKLQIATRHNYQPALGGDITVAETYAYGGPNGRISARATSVNGAFSNNTFSLGQTWDDLGTVHAISYPSNAAFASTPVREVAFSYANALLTGVTGYTTNITHLASGMTSHIAHFNGENEDWAPDPNGMSRPASIHITGNGVDQTFGPYAYDGAGNIKQIGDSANTYTNYRYDGAGRLIKSEAATPTSPTVNQTWSYDSFGNRLGVNSAQTHQFDPNNDGTIDPADIFFLINYLFTGGSAPKGPDGLLSGDANGDGLVDPADIFFVINALFTGGPLPNIPSTAFAGGDDSGVRPADTVTVGTVTATGSTVDVPVYIRDISGTLLGMDQATGAKIQSFSIKVAWSPASAVSSVSFTRAGITSALSPTAESRPSTSISRSLLDTFPESASLIPFTSNAADPGDLVAHLVVTLNGSVAPGSSISLALDPSVTLLANDEGTIKETPARGNLVLVNGAINIPVQGLAIPPTVSAFAEGIASKHALKANASATNDPAPDAQTRPRPPIYLSDAGPSPSSLRRSPTAQSYLTTTNHNDASAYDEAGNVTRDDQGRLLTYDALNMTTGISLPLADGTTRNFLDIYTADDERIALVERLPSGETKTRWTLRGLDNRALRTWTDNTFNGTHTWGWSEDEIFGGATLLAYVSPIGTRHYGVDHLGSSVLLTDANGHLIGNINYDAFGAGGATGAGMLQYTGHERDSANVGAQTGTVRLPDHLHARNYDPLRGRFLSVDQHDGHPEGAQTWNRYSYTWNSPINLVDLDGREPLSPSMAAALQNIYGGRPGDVQVRPFPFLSRGTRAMTLGNTILVSTARYQEGVPWDNYKAVNLEGVTLLAHEYRHVRQYRNLDFGPFLPNFFPTAYAATTVWTGHIYSSSSYFERSAYLTELGIVRADATLTVHASGQPSTLSYSPQYFTTNPFDAGSIRGFGGGVGCMVQRCDFDRRYQDLLAMVIRALVAAAVILSSGCCSCPDQDAFTKLSLQTKIAAVRESNQRGCTCEGAWLWYIDQIASHGNMAVTAVLPLLDDHDKNFPAFDAVSVIRQANRLHYDAHPAVPRLKELAAHGRTSATRENAAAALQEIDAIRWRR